MHSPTPDLLIETTNRVLFITYNRPQAMNALSFEMIQALHEIFTKAAGDNGIVAVVTQGAGEKAYCAGGDVRGLYGSVTGTGPSVHEEFFCTEYTLNYQMHRFFKNTGKPLVALMDGIVMGGGMGVGQPSTLRIVGAKTKMAMPETRIGLFPDVGGTYFLSRCPGAVGLYIGLTSNVINGADAIHAKLADLYFADGAQAAFVNALKAQHWRASPEGAEGVLGDISALARAHAIELPPSALSNVQDAIDRHFTAKPNVQAIIDSLRAVSTSDTHYAWAQQTASDIASRSPTLLEVTKRQLETGATMPLADCFKRELNMMYAAFDQRDVVEGIRAMAIDKDHAPKWKPASLADVTPASIDAFFTPRWAAQDHPLRDLQTHYG
jgi:enoyl-CoA hydratase/carnithine racemase